MGTTQQISKKSLSKNLKMKSTSVDMSLSSAIKKTIRNASISSVNRTKEKELSVGESSEETLRRVVPELLQRNDILMKFKSKRATSRLDSPILVVSTSSFLRHRNKVNQKITGNCDCETPLVRLALANQARESLKQKERNDVDSVPNMGLLQPLNFLEMSCDERCELEKKEAEKNGKKILAAENPATDDKNAEKNTVEATTGTKEDTSEETNSSTPPPQQQQEVGKNLVVKSGVVSDKMFRFGTMSSLAYANEHVEEKEHAWYKFWRTPKVTEQDKVIHGINYIEEHIKTDGKFSETQELDRELSSREATIFVDKAIKEVAVSFKGTNFLSGEDLAADYALFDNDAIKAFGVVGVGAAGGPAAAAVAASASLHVQKHGMKEINEAISLIRNVHAKYSDFTIVTTGHSLGGAKALFVAQMFPTIVSESIAFNPGPLGKKGMTCNNCKIVRTENDIISIQSRGVADVGEKIGCLKLMKVTI
eukprot:g6704.t1